MKAAMAMAAVLQLYTFLAEKWNDSRLFATGEALVGVLLGGVTYIIMVIKGNVFSQQELSFLYY